jgi:hypothetical protein
MRFFMSGRAEERKIQRQDRQDRQGRCAAARGGPSFLLRAFGAREGICKPTLHFALETRPLGGLGGLGVEILSD